MSFTINGREFSCDWPVDGIRCGRPARWFIAVDNAHRPLCSPCVAIATEVAGEKSLDFRPIEEVDPNKVPVKPPTQAERLGLDPDRPIPFRPASSAPPPDATTPDQVWQVGEMTDLIDALGSINRTKPSPAEAVDQEPPSRPSLAQAFHELALSVLLGSREAVDRWRKR